MHLKGSWSPAMLLSKLRVFWGFLLQRKIILFLKNFTHHFLTCCFDRGCPIMFFLTVDVGNSNKLKDGNNDKRVRGCIGVHELQHVHPTLRRDRERITRGTEAAGQGRTQGRTHTSAGARLCLLPQWISNPTAKKAEEHLILPARTAWEGFEFIL